MSARSCIPGNRPAAIAIYLHPIRFPGSRVVETVRGSTGAGRMAVYNWRSSSIRYNWLTNRFISPGIVVFIIAWMRVDCKIMRVDCKIIYSSRKMAYFNPSVERR